MEQTILPILIMANRQGRGREKKKEKKIKNCSQPLIIFLLEKQASVNDKTNKSEGGERKKKTTRGYGITSMAISSRTGAAGCALAALRYLHYNKEQQQQ